MWPFRRRKERYSGSGRQPARKIPAWPFSDVASHVWLNDDGNGACVFTYSIRKKVPKSDYCPKGYSTVFQREDLDAVIECAKKTQELHETWKKAGICR